jgi:hypothetical protein
MNNEQLELRYFINEKTTFRPLTKSGFYISFTQYSVLNFSVLFSFQSRRKQHFRSELQDCKPFFELRRSSLADHKGSSQFLPVPRVCSDSYRKLPGG